ncbi:hypothetical protein [Kribbella sindirgiensis]|uniref:Uncharacterized protein n=1 Tax=Kribbella sindirgiensis TaxID=1124744 RepID=A0A4V2M499_9ACTN|nr:hypothetical protein [Kribbella sindirgiensis]TCC35112.1 hypothetical protein E0H50_14700 [Kribbella sindirgiensis]
MAASYRSSTRFVPTGKYADTAVDVLAEVIQRSPRDADQLYEAVQQVVSENAWGLLFDKKPRNRRVGRKHWLCQMLAEAAEMLDQLADIPGTIGDDVRAECRTAGWGALRSKAAGLAVGHLARLTLTPSLAPVAVLSMKVRVVAVMFCPDSSKHPALENACARQLLRALGFPPGAAA